MSFVISSVLAFLLLYRYFSLFVITFFAAFLIPLPSNLSVVTASSFTTQGLFNIYLVFLVALAGNVTGDLAMYGLARLYGKKIFELVPWFRRFFNSPKYGYYAERMEKYAPVTIVVSRFVTEANPAVNIISGTIPVPFFRYFKYEFLGEFLNVTAFTLAGYFLGLQGLSILQTAIYLFLAVVSTWITVNVIRRIFRIRKVKNRALK